MGSIEVDVSLPSSAASEPVPNPTPAAKVVSDLFPSSVAAPPPTDPVISPPRFLIIGAGSRGNSYARSVTRATRGIIAAVAEPRKHQREEFGRRYVWGPRGRRSPAPNEAFVSWEEWLDYEIQRREREIQGHEVEAGVDGIFVCTLDEMHKEIIISIAKKGVRVHVLCEKPLATSWQDCLEIWRSMKNYGRVFGIGHVLRYSPHNMLLRKLLLEDNVIGDIVSIEHTEPVGWWHYSHSYVRGNWRRRTLEGVGALLTKSCHDIDFLMWLLCSPPPTPHLTTYPVAPHLPKTIASTGHLSHFRNSRKPHLAGKATNCLSCPAESACIYSAKKIYVDLNLYGERDTGWPVNIVAPEIEDAFNVSSWKGAEKSLMEKLAEDYTSDTPDAEVAKRGWYGRCVYESDNNVCDDQVVTITWDDESLPSNSTIEDGDLTENLLPHRGAKMAVFHMVANTKRQCERYGVVSGTLGVLEYDGFTITAHSFVTNKTTTWKPPRANAKEQGHGGGDDGLARQFVIAVEAVKAGKMDGEEASKLYLGVTLEECVRSHAVVFAAEESRMNEGKTLKWKEWFSQNWVDSV